LTWETLIRMPAVECKLGQSGITFDVQYDENVLPSEHVQRMLFQFEHIIHQLAAEPQNTTVSQLDLVAPNDLRQISKWNSVQPETIEVTVHGIVEVQALIRPEAAAICSFDGEFTYRELNNLSNNLAHHLVNMGVGPEVKVPLCFSKSSWTIIAMLAVMKAGGVCVLVNPEHPIARLQGIFEDVEATVLLCDSSRVGLLMRYP
jgi:non-ribosomal peptide synthetase component F